MIDLTFLEKLDYVQLQEVYDTGIKETLQYLDTGAWPNKEIAELEHHSEFQFRRYDLTESEKMKIALCSGLEYAVNMVYLPLQEHYRFTKHIESDEPFSFAIEQFSLDDACFHGQIQLITWPSNLGFHRLRYQSFSRTQPDLKRLLGMVVTHLSANVQSSDWWCPICGPKERHVIYEDDELTRWVDENGHEHTELKMTIEDFFGLDDEGEGKEPGPVTHWGYGDRHYVFDVCYQNKVYRVVHKDGYFQYLEPEPKTNEDSTAILSLVKQWFKKNHVTV
ncbi:hypothetical protein LLE49_24745 [Alicyclobacillus tolerans]|uniref:hypothetical protein n=1 Tax=Alicyclobacillus tolerans TaxID=90970 RepID=UPI001F44D389|nr:hypothetical protein [Alicyclobacillus tolerans]MCF8567936.1 hypothetical protein [Alicyclobacillus tolerans]